MCPQKPLFDNDKVTELAKQYLDSGCSDPKLIGKILTESRTLLAVVANKLTQDMILREDLMQEARLKLLTALPKWDPEAGSKIYSYFSIVFRNAMIDYLRKEQTTSELDDRMEDDEPKSDEDFAAMVSEDMISWFEERFPTVLKGRDAPAILFSVINDMLDMDTGKHLTSDQISKDFKLSKKDARLIYDAVIAKLRILMDNPRPPNAPTPERSLHPELRELLGDDTYRSANEVFSGMSFRFKKGS